MSKLGFYPNPATVTLDDFLAKRQADAGTRILFLVCVQTAKDSKNLFLIHRLYANPVVVY